MNTLERLEDRRRDWQTACAASLAEWAEGLVSRLASRLPDPAGPLTPEQSAGASALSDAVRDGSEKQLLPRCLVWLREEKLWPDTPPEPHVESELSAALQHLPRFDPAPPEPVPVVPTWSWAVAAGVGAFLGMLLLTPLALLLLNQREAGLFVGGIAGAVGLVMLIGFLAASPRLRAAMSAALVVAGAGSVAGALWSYWRGRSSTNWFKASLGFLASGFVLLLAHPRLRWPARADYLARVRRELDGHLRHVADLILVWCWAHPARLPPSPESGSQAPLLPGLVCAALADLRTQLIGSNGTPADLRDSVEELLQRFEDDGYEWKTVAADTPFDEAMREDFDTFGVIVPGQPVRTRRAALRHRGQLVRKGELRRA